MKYQAVIFDLFGTLVNVFSRAEYENVLDEMIAILKAPRDEFIKEWYRTGKMRATGEYPTLGKNLEYIMRELNTNFTKEQIERATKVRMDYVARALEPKPDAIDTLKQLKSKDYKIALISNCSTEPPVIWPQTPFAQYFDAAVFSSTSGLQKPDPRIYILAAEKLGVKPEDSLYIGDGDGNELTGAAQVGMHPVLIRDINETKQNVMRSGYQGDTWDGVVINSLSALLNLL
jgi:putative hydrolase of the HAD superfamily